MLAYCLLACDCLLACCQKINKNLIPSQPAIVPASRGFFTKIVHDMTAGRRARRASSQPATSQPFYLFASFFFFGNKIKAPAHTHARNPSIFFDGSWFWKLGRFAPLEGSHYCISAEFDRTCHKNRVHASLDGLYSSRCPSNSNDHGGLRFAAWW